MARARRLGLGLLGALSLAGGEGCAGSSPYDRAWVEGSVGRVAGAKVRAVEVSNDAKDLAPSLPPGVASLEGLTESDAVATALWNNAQLRADLAQLGLARADLADANALPSRLEADLARADALAAEDLATRAKAERGISETRLRLLLGLAECPLGERLRVVARDRGEGAPVDAAKAERTALASRPDLRASELLVEASLERAGLEKAKIVQVFARLDAKPVGTRGGAPVLLVPGFAADIPIFSQNPGGRARAQADIERAVLSYVAKRHEVLTDVRIAAQELEVAEGSLRPWRETIVPLQETNVTVAQSAYAAGAEAYVVVLEATRRLVEARLRAVDLELDRRRARARLDRAVGWRVSE